MQQIRLWPENPFLFSLPPSTLWYATVAQENAFESLEQLPERSAPQLHPGQQLAQVRSIVILELQNGWEGTKAGSNFIIPWCHVWGRIRIIVQVLGNRYLRPCIREGCNVPANMARSSLLTRRLLLQSSRTYRFLLMSAGILRDKRAFLEWDDEMTGIYSFWLVVDQIWDRSILFWHVFNVDRTTKAFFKLGSNRDREVFSCQTSLWHGHIMIKTVFSLTNQVGCQLTTRQCYFILAFLNWVLGTTGYSTICSWSDTNPSSLSFSFSH